MRVYQNICKETPLNNSDISNHYTVTLRNNLDTLQETFEKHTTNDEFENFITTHIEAAAECIPTKPKAKYRVSWKSIAVTEKRDNLKKILT